MDIETAYSTTRAALVALAADLTPEQVATPVPALPGWTVKDAYAHVAGVCADVLDGRSGDGGSEAWTAAQVAARAATPFAAVVGEWRDRGPALDAWIREAPPSRSMFLALDAYTHEQDVRAAIGGRGARDDPRVAFLAGVSRDAFDRRFRKAEVPALRLLEPTGEFVLGEGEPAIALRVDDYELMRMLFGRRSAAQMRAARWSGDPTPVLEHFHLFPLPEGDLVD